jgi:hypothetical protein
MSATGSLSHSENSRLPRSVMAAFRRGGSPSPGSASWNSTSPSACRVSGTRYTSGRRTVQMVPNSPPVDRLLPRAKPRFGLRLGSPRTAHSGGRGSAQQPFTPDTGRSGLRGHGPSMSGFGGWQSQNEPLRRTAAGGLSLCALGSVVDGRQRADRDLPRALLGGAPALGDAAHFGSSCGSTLLFR